MSNCTGAPAELWLERYIQGTLPDSESQTFEEHYFDCPVCLAQVQALQAATAELARNPVKTPKAILQWPRVIAALGAIAALLLIGFIGYQMFGNKPVQPAIANEPAKQPSTPSQPSRTPPSPIPHPTLSQLADLALPPFHVSTLRGDNRDSAFQAGMKAYAKGDCHAVVNALGPISSTDKDALAAEFYTGACQMHLGNLASASKSLRQVAAAGDSPQQEAALYYLAQIALAQNKLDAARHGLQQTIALRGDFEARARKQLAALPANPPAQ